GEIDVGEIAYRQDPVRHDAEHQDAAHDERRGDRPANEQFGDVHEGASLPPTSLTFVPGTRRSWPSVTTFSPGCSPFWMMVSCSVPRLTVTSRDSTVISDLTTNTYWPCCPLWMAAEGTMMALGCVAR